MPVLKMASKWIEWDDGIEVCEKIFAFTREHHNGVISAWNQNSIRFNQVPHNFCCKNIFFSGRASVTLHSTLEIRTKRQNYQISIRRVYEPGVWVYVTPRTEFWFSSSKSKIEWQDYTRIILHVISSLSSYFIDSDHYIVIIMAYCVIFFFFRLSHICVCAGLRCSELLLLRNRVGGTDGGVCR